MQTQIPYLALTFDLPLHAGDIPAFRGALARLAGQDALNELFHNHNNDPEQRANYHHRYPLVQYRVQGPHAMVVGVGQGADALASLRDSGRFRGFRIRGHRHPLRVIDEAIRTDIALDVHPTDLPHRYRLTRYLPFSESRYREYKALPGLREKTELLERLLRNHLVSFAYGVGWALPPERRLQVRLTEINRIRKVHALKQPYMAFDLHFDSNARLPTGIALGRKAAFGFGTLVQL